MEIKLAQLIFQIFGYLSYGGAIIIISFSDFRAWVLFLAGLVFAAYKVYNIHMDTQKKNLNLKIIREIERIGYQSQPI